MCDKMPVTDLPKKISAIWPGNNQEERGDFLPSYIFHNSSLGACGASQNARSEDNSVAVSKTSKPYFGQAFAPRNSDRSSELVFFLKKKKERWNVCVL